MNCYIASGYYGYYDIAIEFVGYWKRMQALIVGVTLTKIIACTLELLVNILLLLLLYM